MQFTVNKLNESGILNIDTVISDDLNCKMN